MTVSKSTQDYEDELAEVRRKIEDAGRHSKPVGQDENAGIKGDFELPCSTFLKLQGERCRERKFSFSRGSCR